MNEPSTWLVWLLAANFVGLGALLILAPRLGAALFGLPALKGAAFGYAATVLIPIGDMIVVAAERGLDGWGYLLLHGLSAAIMAGAAAWIFRQAANDNKGGLQA